MKKKRCDSFEFQTERTCISCEVTKPVAEFYSYAYTTTGGNRGVRYDSSCRDCARLDRICRYDSDASLERLRNLASRETPQVKQCRECKAIKPISEFYRHARAWDGHINCCIPCHKIKNAEGPAEKRRRAKTFRKHILKTRYGLTPEEYGQMRDAQGGACLICQCVSAETLCVDHCHDTGRVRGLLCRRCNLALGYVRESAAVARSLVSYIEGYC